ncbi:MAG: FeoA domain-containing protein [Cyanobacteria bacterium SBLK]|nr:FeoA domain-containing protein [Cyanobacteria bacterium SBLK]
MSLIELQVGILARVEKIADVGENIALENTALGRLSQRLQAMGILQDRPIEVLRRSGFGGPLHIRTGQTTELAIRQQEAALIMVRVMN